MKLVLSPHQDDETLFAGYTIARETPLVVGVFDSYAQPSRGFAEAGLIQRRNETLVAITILTDGQSKVRVCGLRDDVEYDPLEVFQSICKIVPEEVDEVWAPLYERDGHHGHNEVARAADNFACTVHRYTTYTRTLGRTRTPNRVNPTGDQIRKKLRALAAYKSQIEIEELGCRPWFTQGLDEYFA